MCICSSPCRQSIRWTGDRFPERKDGDPNSAGLCKATREFCGLVVLGTGGGWVSMVARDEVAVRRYIQEQEKEDRRLDQLTLMPI